MNILTLVNVSKTFKNQPEPLFSDLSYTFKSDESYAIMAPSGSGKSTLLAMLANLENFQAGSITLQENNHFKKITHDTVGIIFQNPNLIQELTILENVLLASIIKNKFDDIYIQKAHTLLETVGLIEKKKDFIYQLSGGQQQRVAIARSLLLPPIFLLADEPTGNLDQQNAHKIMNLILNYCTQHSIGLIISTHDKNIAAMCNHTLTISNHRLISYKPG